MLSAGRDGIIIIFSFYISACLCFIVACAGWLNAINFFKMNRYYDLDLRIEDNRRLAAAIVYIFVNGGGLSISGEKYRRMYDLEFIPGWEIPAMWDVGMYTGNLPKAFPSDGNFICTIVMKDDENKEKSAR